MASYFNSKEIQVSLQELVKEYVEECKECDKLPEDFIDLIKHNFLAKYVIYNKKKKEIEIGVEESGFTEGYPEIKAYKFPIDKAAKWLDRTFREHKNDLEFYGRLLNRKGIMNSSEIVLMK